MKKNNSGEVATPISIIDPSISQRRTALEQDALGLVESMLTEARESDDVSEMSIALNAYTKYKKSYQEDSSYLIEKLDSLDDRKLKLLEKALIFKDKLDKFAKGDISLHEIYNLPQVKKHTRG